MSKAGEVLAVLRARDIRLMVDGDQLRYDAPAGGMTPEVETLLRKHKAALLAMLAMLFHAAPATAIPAPAPQLPEPLTQCFPCVVCQRTDRWDDHGIWRCRRCWPPGSLEKQATPHTFPDPARSA